MCVCLCGCVCVRVCLFVCCFWQADVVAARFRPVAARWDLASLWGTNPHHVLDPPEMVQRGDWVGDDQPLSWHTGSLPCNAKGHTEMKGAYPV